MVLRRVPDEPKTFLTDGLHFLVEFVNLTTVGGQEDKSFTLMITTKCLLTALACDLLAMVAPSQLHADNPNVLITGSATFFGSASASGASCQQCITTVFFPPSEQVFLTGTGIYAGIPQTPATFAPSFSFIGDGNVTLVAPVPNLWAFQFGGNSYSFNLLSLSGGHTESGAMAVAGTGVLFATGFDPTPANIGISGTGANFDYQFFLNGTVPEPSSVALTGFGLAVCGAIAYFRRRRD